MKHFFLNSVPIGIDSSHFCRIGTESTKVRRKFVDSVPIREKFDESVPIDTDRYRISGKIFHRDPMRNPHAEFPYPQCGMRNPQCWMRNPHAGRSEKITMVPHSAEVWTSLKDLKCFIQFLNVKWKLDGNSVFLLFKVLCLKQCKMKESENNIVFLHHFSVGRGVPSCHPVYAFELMGCSWK